MKRYHVSGMGCEACVKRVEKAVGALEGVRHAAVSLESETLSIDYDETKTGFEALKNAVEEAGYSLEEV